MGDILTIREIAEDLKVSDRTVKNWIDGGKLKAFKFGAQYRIKKADFENFINQSEVKTEDTNNN